MPCIDVQHDKELLITHLMVTLNEGHDDGARSNVPKIVEFAILWVVSEPNRLMWMYLIHVYSIESFKISVIYYFNIYIQGLHIFNIIQSMVCVTLNGTISCSFRSIFR